VRHILISLSFLFLSSPVIGQETGVLFLRLENGDVKYYENRIEDRDGKYVGEINNGKPNGQGKFSWSDGKKYVGEYKEDLMNGQGTISWSNREKFVGEWKDGKRWNGTYYDKEGNIHSKVVNGKGQK